MYELASLEKNDKEVELERKRIVTNTHDSFHVDVAIGLLLKENAYARLYCQRITTGTSVDTLSDKPHSGMARIRNEQTSLRSAP
jgi:hypothetical protein